MKTAPLICQNIHYRVAQWCKLPCGTPPRVLLDATGALVSRADSTKDDIGWNNFIKGRIAKEWCQAQAQYCRDMPDIPAHNSITWSTKLIKAIWLIFVNVWNA
eukprot:7250358-Ditylum_brightwellii.AAC.1